MPEVTHRFFQAGCTACISEGVKRREAPDLDPDRQSSTPPSRLSPESEKESEKESEMESEKESEKKSEK